MVIAAKAEALPSNSVENFWKLEFEDQAPPQVLESAQVSWYGPGFHGRRTASGERFNKNAFTCASKELPFGTLLEVRNPSNDQSVVLRVNDRGPYVRGRSLDLSYAAAKALGFHRQGTAEVHYRILSNP